ncbi:hypothetical protein Tco_0221479 [Tanacetum coccineum]
MKSFNPNKTSSFERKYTTSITKMKAARYELVDSEYGKCKGRQTNGYGYLEEIMVRRVDRQPYKFKEGDFINLHLNDIKDMLLLVVQHKLFHLDGEVIVDLAVALRIMVDLIDKRMLERRILRNLERLADAEDNMILS